MSIQILPMNVSDYEPVIELWRASEGIGLSDADSRDNIARYLDRNPELSFVAREGGRIVGAVLCGHDGRRGYLHHLAVSPDCRKRGVGRALAVSALNALHAIGIRKCHLFVFQSNDRARVFWQRIGWKERVELQLMSVDVSQNS